MARREFFHRGLGSCVIAALVAACSTPRMDRAARERRWDEVLAREIPAGTPRTTATDILGGYGLHVLYTASAHLGERPDECPAARLYATEYGAVHGLGSRFDVRLILCLDAEERVSHAQVDRLNALN